MDIFEYNEVRWPTRALQQEEEEDAIATAQHNLQPPVFEWRDGAQTPPQVQLLVVALSPASCALVETCLAASSSAKAIATIRSASSAKDTDSSSATPEAASATLYRADEQGQALVCCCSSAVPPEQAPAWARGLMQQLQPQRLVLFGSMPVEHYRGDADPSQAFVAFLLQSSAAQNAATDPKQRVAPYLPSGSVVAGLAAALISQAELQKVAACLLVTVDMVPALVPSTLHELAGLMSSSLQQMHTTDDGSWVLQLQTEGVIEQARTKLQQTSCRPSSVYS